MMACLQRAHHITGWVRVFDEQGGALRVAGGWFDAGIPPVGRLVELASGRGGAGMRGWRASRE